MWIGSGARARHCGGMLLGHVGLGDVGGGGCQGLIKVMHRSSARGSTCIHRSVTNKHPSFHLW